MTPSVSAKPATGFLVLPVSMSAALSWVRGELGDAALLTGGDYLAPAGEAIWICSLYGAVNTRGMIRELLRWPAARAVVWRTDAPMVMRLGEKFGALPVFTEPDGRRRFIVLRPGIVALRERFGASHRLDATPLS